MLKFSCRLEIYIKGVVYNMAKNKDVIKFLVQYHGLRRLLSQESVKKILDGKANFTGPNAETDLNALKAAKRYVDSVGKLMVGSEKIDQYVSRLEDLYLAGDPSKKIGVHDADYPTYLAAVLAQDKFGDAQEKIATAIEDNPEIKAEIANLPLTLGKEKGMSYVSIVTNYLGLGASVSGLRGNLTEANGATVRERERNTRLSEIIKERNKRIADLEKVDAGFVKVMEKLDAGLLKDDERNAIMGMVAEIAQIRASVGDGFDALGKQVGSIETTVKGIKASQQVTNQKLGNLTGAVTSAVITLTDHIYGAESGILAGIDSVRDEVGKGGKRITRAVGHAAGRTIGELRTIGERLDSRVTAEANRVIADVNAHTDSAVNAGVADVNAHTTSEANRIISSINTKRTVGKFVTGAVAFVLVVGAFLGGVFIPKKADTQINATNTDTGYKIVRFAEDIKLATDDGKLTYAEYSELAKSIPAETETEKAGERIAKTAMLSDAKQKVEIAQYKDFKNLVDTSIMFNEIAPANAEAVDSKLTADEKAAIEAKIDEYKADDFEGEFSSTEIMNATYASTSAYSDLSALYQNILNGPVETLPNYSADMAAAMSVLETAVEDGKLTAEEKSEIETLVANLKATNDDTAELFAEQIEGVVDSFVSAEGLVSGLQAENSGLKTENDGLKVENERLEQDLDNANQTIANLQTELDAAKDEVERINGLYTDAQNTIAELEATDKANKDKIAELEQQIIDDAIAASEAYAGLEARYNKAVEDYNTLLAEYKKIVAESGARITELEQALIAAQAELNEAISELATLQEKVGDMEGIILQLYHEDTYQNGTLEDAINYYKGQTGDLENGQGSSSNDPNAPSYGG